MATKSKQDVFDAMQLMTNEIMAAESVFIDVKHEYKQDPISEEHHVKGKGVTYTIKLNGGADQDAPTVQPSKLRLIQ